MSPNQSLALTIAPRVRKHALAMLESADFPQPTLCLLKVRTDTESEEHWALATYAPANINALEPEWKQKGHALLYDVDGLVIAIPQFQFLPELQGAILTLSDGRLVVTRDADDI